VKGIVFTLLERAVVEDYGEDAWDDLLDGAGLVGAYTSLGDYPDDDLRRLVEQASRTLGLPPQDIIRWFGRRALPALAASFPGFFRDHPNTRSFLRTLNEIIHPEVRKLYPGADVPWFDFQETPEGGLVMGYVSQRKLCAFAEGLIEGAAGHFGEPVSIAQPTCMLRGDPACALVLQFG
jgi:hypothetical protein